MPAPVLQFKRGNAGVAGTVPALRPGEPAISLNNFDFFIGIDTSVANNKFFGSHRYWGREDGTNSLKLKLVDKDGSNYVAVKSPDTLAGNVTYVLPGTQGYSGTVLTNDGSGNLTWGSGSNNATFTGISTFSDTTDNTLGDANTGAVQIKGGLGVTKNVTIGANLNVQGYSEFVGVVTFRGGTINIGDSNTDNINVGGEFVSNLVPNTDNTYDLGIGTQRWRNLELSGIATIGSLVCNDGGTFTGSVQIDGGLNVNGNITLGGTSIYQAAQSVTIKDKDIVLGVTTDLSLYPDTSTDNTANHGGVAVASTEGSPLVSLKAVGINSLPDTYKQIMWMKSGTWTGLGTDAWMFNYGVGIGSTQVPAGVRLAVGGVQVTDNAITATTFNGSLNGNASSSDQVKTVTASNNNSTYYVTFVDANNGSATNETVYTDDGIYYNPGTNTFTSQYGHFTGDLTVDGAINAGSITGTASTATRATTVDTTSTGTNTNYHLVFTDNATSTTGATMRVDAGIYYNPSSNYLFASQFIGDVSAALIKSASASTVLTLSGTDATFANNVNITGIATVGSDLTVGGNNIKASDGNTNITLTSNTLTTFAGDIKVVGNDIINGNSETALSFNNGINSGDVKTGGTLIVGGNSIRSANQTSCLTLTNNTGDVAVTGDLTVTGNDIKSSTATALTLSGADVTVAGDLQVTGNNIKSSTGATAITLSANDVTVTDDLTVGGNLYVNGNTTQVNTTSLTVEDRTIELGVVDGSTPSSTTTWDLGVLFNYYNGSAKKSAVIWEQGDARFKLGSVVSDSGGIGNNNPQITFTSYAALEISDLWINNSCTGGSAQVIGCVGSELQLQNIVVDAGTF